MCMVTIILVIDTSERKLSDGTANDRITPANVLGGFGMVATQNIPKGTLILEDNPLLVVDTHILSDNWNGGTAFFNNERASITNRIRYALGSTDWRNKRPRFRLLDDGSPRLVVPNPPNLRVRDVNIVDTNAWGFRNPGVNENTWLVVLGDLSRVNHSCVPNAFTTEVCTNNGQVGRMKLIATKDIEIGEEIVVEYTKEDSWLQPCNARRRTLQRGWGFQCHCNACEDSGFTNCEWRLARMLKAEIDLLPRPTAAESFLLAKRIYAANKYVGILEFWGFGDRRLSEAYLRLAELYVLAEWYAEARKVTITGLEIEGWYYDINEVGRELNQMLARCGVRRP
ncbi:hypothetical protein N0V83_010655 [Neocucurbitaria cava]|uniref:SET domain-containing protein n=1 Tax=Neocucurbitaria cava TaxID=798079 RepID=A0A9W8XYR1_9PLEO|nr:hypothetical protein N0V83_010655 [Neocucurbitaria cava]